MADGLEVGNRQPVTATILVVAVRLVQVYEGMDLAIDA